MIDPFYEYQSPLAAYTTPQQQVQVQAEKPPLIYREYRRAPPLYQKRVVDERERFYTYKPYKKLERWTEKQHRRLEKYRRSREERYRERGISTRGIAFETGVAKGIVDIPLYGVAAVGGAELAVRKPREFPKYAAIGVAMWGKGLYRGFKKDPWETVGYLAGGVLAGKMVGRVGKVPRPRFGERIPSPRVEVVERGGIRMRPTRPKRGIYLREVIDVEKAMRGRPMLPEPKKLLTAPREPEWKPRIREIQKGLRETDVRWAEIQRGWERLHARAEPKRARVRVKTATRPRVILQEMREPQVATLVKAKPRVMVAERVRLHPMFLEMKPAPKTKLALRTLTVPLVLPRTKTKTKTKTITATQLLTKPKTETKTKTRTKTLTALMVMPITKTQAKTATRTAVQVKTQTLTRTLTKTKPLTIPKTKVVTFTGLEVKPPLPLMGDWEKKYLRRGKRRKRRTIEWYIENPIALLW
ncbi:MAG: hypothetical protein DRO11_08960 [Methanobacteriota archaeon]|nr:MAG: hypothetical protein DRO11_08960 [Euryarchaeota archaeon]